QTLTLSLLAVSSTQLDPALLRRRRSACKQACLCCMRCARLSSSTAVLLRKHIEAAGGLFSLSTATGMDADDKAPAGAVAERIMPHLLNIYGSRATARDFEIYIRAQRHV
ncbi:unnamed protein product, partial [Urochloa humidicola]